MYKFLDVFRTLKLPDDIRVYMENVEVTKVSKTSTNSLARVYIKNDKVISKKIIYKVEDALKKQVFRIQNMDVRIIDRYVFPSSIHHRLLWMFIMIVYCLNSKNTGLLNIIF